jgi:hypothetical protein
VGLATFSALASTLSPDAARHAAHVSSAQAAGGIIPLLERRPHSHDPAPSGSGAKPRGWLTARVIEPVLLRISPGGARIARLGTRTEFGSPRVFSVVRRRGAWLGVMTPQTGNGRLGWVSASKVRLGRVRESVVISLSGRRLELRSGKRVLRTVHVGIGRSSSPTPLGRFAVTDRLRITGSTPYGCCALALSGHQPNVPADWQGGDRLAIHGTPDPKTVGAAASLGCLHASAADMRRLLRDVPLGAPVFVRA